ncbi:hypothetical protein PR048_032857 [Dryococelus australis]|uniref:Uncharacterized protein n=1 Tax=Dryococelus australis TaxID=614101 RepID=A0ABQ9G3E0_9NEOP|nr:hypothetical protein PR048_032857 [Dryococelus australis]
MSLSHHTNVTIILIPANTTLITKPMDQEKTVRNCVYRVAHAVKEISPDAVRKCFAKAGFKEIDETDDEDNQTLHELADLLRRGHQDIDAEAVPLFHSMAISTLKKALKEHNPADETDQEDDDGKNNNQEDESKQTVDNLKIKSYAEALCAVRGFEEFPAIINCSMLVELMQNDKA